MAANNLDLQEIELFNKRVLFKSYKCTNDKNITIKSKPFFKLTIKLTDECNCSCSFCSNKNIRDFGKLDFNKVEEVLRELNKTGYLARVGITGGEPMMYPDQVNRLVNLILSINNKINIGITTNGLNLKKFLEFDNVEKIEGIHISRHHYDDEINKKLFNNDNIATSEDIKYLQSKLKDKLIININTVLIKGYIDSTEEVKKMCDYIDTLGVRRIGLVSLLKLNDFAKEHFIDCNEIFNNLDSSFFVGHHFHNHDFCECVDGIYYSKNKNLIEFYSIMSKEKKCPYITQLVYTTNNQLKTGFSGEVIY